MAKKRNVHGDVLVPFLISPSAWTAMRTLSSWSPRGCELDDGEDDGSDALAIVGGDDCRMESAGPALARVHSTGIHVFANLPKRVNP